MQLSSLVKDCYKYYGKCNKLHARTDRDRNWLPARRVEITSYIDGTPVTNKVIETAAGSYGRAALSRHPQLLLNVGDRNVHLLLLLSPMPFMVSL